MIASMDSTLVDGNLIALWLILGAAGLLCLYAWLDRRLGAAQEPPVQGPAPLRSSWSSEHDPLS